MKRSRVNRSSSFGDIRVINPPPPAAASAFLCDPRAAPTVISPYARPPQLWDVPRVGILTVSAPEVAVEMGQPPGGQGNHFLDTCFLCKKRLRQYDERFMYGDFRAFCAPECRNKQIDIDDEKQKVSKQSTGRKTESSKKKGLKYRPGAQLEKHAS